VTPSRTLAGLFALTTLLASIFAWNERGARRAAEARLAAATAATVETAAPDEGRAPETLAPREPLGEDPGEVASDTAAHPSAGVTRPNARAAEQSGSERRRWAAMMEDPEFARLWTLQQKAQLDGRFAELFRRLNLPPEKLEQLKTLLMERQASPRDVISAARSQGIDPRQNRPQMQQLIRETTAELDNAIAALLGPQGYQTFQHYEQTGPQRQAVSQLEERLSYTPTPLNPQQVDQLVQLLATPPGGTPATPANGAAAGRTTSRGLARITDDAIARARAVLTPAQVSALEQLKAEQDAQADMQRLWRERRTPTPTPVPTRG
jgi:hypothetical protein